MFDMEAHKAAQRVRKINKALEALPQATGGDWGCSASGELLSDPIGSVKIAKYVSGMHAAQAGANRCLLEAARELAEEVVRLRGLVQQLETDIAAIR